MGMLTLERTGYFWMRQLRSIVQSLTSEAVDSLVHAFISCRLDYCNALLYRVRHCRRPTSATAISPERSCASGDWNPAHRPHYAGSPVSSLAAGATTRHFQVGDTGSQVLERPSTRLSGRRLPSCWPWSSWLTVSRQYDAGHPLYNDVTGRQSICRSWIACLEQTSSCHPCSVTVAVNLRKAAENLFVCLRVAALVTYELAPWKCTD